MQKGGKLRGRKNNFKLQGGFDDESGNPRFWAQKRKKELRFTRVGVFKSSAPAKETHQHLIGKHQRNGTAITVKASQPKRLRKEQLGDYRTWGTLGWLQYEMSPSLGCPREKNTHKTGRKVLDSYGKTLRDETTPKKRKVDGGPSS